MTSYEVLAAKREPCKLYIYIRVSVGLRNTKECSMSYRQSEMCKLTTYLKDLPQQSVSSKKNLQVVEDSF